MDGKGTLQLYDGFLRFRASDGEIFEDQIRRRRYSHWIGEASLRDSYLKAPSSSRWDIPPASIG